MNKEKKSNFVNPCQKQNDSNKQKYNIKATRPSSVRWEELKLVLDNDSNQNKKVSTMHSAKNLKPQIKSSAPSSSINLQSNKNKKNIISSQKKTVLYFPCSLSKIKSYYDVFGYFNGPILKENKTDLKHKKIELKIEISFEFQIANHHKIVLSLDENKLCHYSSGSLENQQPTQEQSQAKNENQNLYYQMQWNQYYSNMIAHSNSFPKVQFVPVVQGYALYPQNQQYQQQILKAQQLNQSSSLGSILPNQAKEEK